ncbi:MAG: hypothetical protein SFU56_04350 [Capsulimonadales bacterium]|nr:hypothetical protein [Capsulimonadales bacterium]
MNVRNLIGGLAAATLVTVASHAPAHAIDPLATFNGKTAGGFSFTSDNNGSGTLVTEDGGTKVGLTSLVNDPDAFDGNAWFQFGPITQVANSATNDNGSLDALFSGGTFTFYTKKNGKGSLLLSGTFNKAVFSSDSASSAGLQSDLLFNDVTYTGGSVLDQYLALNPGTSAIGTFSLSFSGLNWNNNRGVTNGGLNSFIATGSGTFDVMAVPEPGEYAAMGLIGLTLGGLILRARNKSVKSVKTLA